MEVTVIKSNRKTMAIQVDFNQNVTVRTPYSVSEKYIEEFLKKNEAWINKKLEEIAEKKKHIKPKASEKVTFEQIRELADKACVTIPARVEYFAKIIGVTYGRITIRNQKTRWGVVAARGI